MSPRRGGDVVRLRARWVLPGALTLLLAVALALGLSAPARPLRLALAGRLQLVVPVDWVLPDAPWAHVSPPLLPPPGLDGLRAADCGACHRQHYLEWRRSAHAHAFTDLQFQSEIRKPGSPRWLCENCHLPIDNQRPERVVGLRGGDLWRPVLEQNPGFDSALREEGVTCAVCHLRRDPDGRSYVLGTLGGTRPPHPVRIDRQALVARCYDCHQQARRIGRALVCWFQSGQELAEGPWAGQRQCPDCHLPAEERPLTVKDTPPRPAHRHRFAGGGVPKDFALYQADDPTGEPPSAGTDYRPALDLEVAVEALGPDRFQVTVELDNARAGHRVPTGDPERHVVIEALLLDAGGQLLGREALRIGQLWRWDPDAEQVFDNRMAPRERRTWLAHLAVGQYGRRGFFPPGAAGAPAAAIAARAEGRSASALLPPAGAGPPARLVVLASHVRLSDENGAYMAGRAGELEARFSREVAALPLHYPFARWFFRAEVALGPDGQAAGAPRLASPAELEARSAGRRGADDLSSGL